MPNQYDRDSPWRDEAKVALLRRMIGEGAFRSDIARALGVTRSAVIGKVKRLGLGLVGDAGKEARAAAAKRWSAACGPKAYRRRTNTGETREAEKMPAPGTAAKRPPRGHDIRVGVNDTHRGPTLIAVTKAPLMLSLLELTPRSCRWPFGDPDRPGFGFCGHAQAEGSSYCGAHRDISVGAAEAPDTQATAA
jgi:GcrA cell cycle regulator